MNPQEPVRPEPDAPQQNPIDSVDDPPTNDGLDDYDVTDADSFPASDPPQQP
ncbi:MAG: hypothetical protein ABR591_02340 [Candidatus Velthaea sp.]